MKLAHKLHAPGAGVDAGVVDLAVAAAVDLAVGGATNAEAVSKADTKYVLQNGRDLQGLSRFFMATSYERTMKTAARRMANPNNMVKRPMRGESLIRIFSTAANSEVGLSLSARTFGPMN